MTSTFRGFPSKEKAEESSTPLGEDREKSTASSQAEKEPCGFCGKRIDGPAVIDGIWPLHPECAEQDKRAIAESEARMQRLRDAGWKEERCGACGGHGQTWVGDSSPDGLADCTCNDGYYWVTPKGRHALYPGGPFCGRS